MKFKYILTSVLAVAGVGLAHPAHADAGSAKDAATRQLIDIVLSKAQWQKMVKATDAVLDARLPPQAAGAVGLEDMVSYPQMVELETNLLNKYYTASEIKQLIAFYKTPIGQKSLRIMPQLAQEVQRFIGTQIRAKLPAMIEKVRAASQKTAK